MFSKKNRVHIDEDKAPIKLYKIIWNHMKQKYTSSMDLVILCIGTDRSTGDSLGPFTGTILKKETYYFKNIFGTIKDPVHANNLDEIIKKINKKFYMPYIIAIDAGLGKQSSVGCIDVKNGPLKPGTGVNKKLTEVGNMHITGLVNIGGYMEYLVLQSTRLKLVLQMAEIIAKGLKNSIYRIEKAKTVIDK